MIARTLLALFVAGLLSSYHGQDAHVPVPNGVAEKRMEHSVKTPCILTLSSPVDEYGWDDAPLPVILSIVNVTGLPMQVDRSALVGITINGKGNTYNFNKHLSPRPGESMTVAPGESVKLRFNLKDYWHQPEPPAGSYGIVLRFMIQEAIQASNEVVIRIRKERKE